MVANINSGSSLYGALSYNQNKVDEGEAKVLLTNKIFESKDGNFDLYKCIDSFERQLPQDIKTEKPVMHISLNPHPDDKLTDQQLSDIAEEYLQKLGYGNQPFMVFKHEDIERHHLHIVTLRVDENGKKLNDKFEFRKSKEITKEIEQKYNLHPADKKQFKEEQRFDKVNYKAGDVRKQVSNTVKGVLKSYQFQSFNEYKTLLSLYNVHAEEVKGEINGTPYQGIVYSATNNKGVKKGNPFKSSLLGKSTGIQAIESRIKYSSDKWKEGTVKDRIKKKVNYSLHTSGSRKQFEENLKKNGIDVVFRQNESGRIYGVTFIDHDNRAAINGSRLGKEFSANNFEGLFQSLQNSSPTQQTFHEQSFSDSGKSISPNSNMIDIRGNSSAPEVSPSEPSQKKKRKRKRRIY